MNKLSFLAIPVYFLDSEAEVVLKIIKMVGKIDIYIRLCVVIVALILLKAMTVTSNMIYLYILLIASFAFNTYLEICMSRTTNPKRPQEM